MVAYELLMSMAVSVILVIDGSVFSVVQVSLKQYLSKHFILLLMTALSRWRPFRDV